MNTRRKLVLAIFVFVVLLVVREFGILDWSLYRSHSETKSQVTLVWAPNDDGMRVRGYDDHLPLGPWKTVALQDGNTLRYAETLSYSWTRWLPLIKVGHIQVQQRFVVTSGNQTIATGRRVADTAVRAFGLLSAHKYGELVRAENATQLRRAVSRQLAERPASEVTSAAPLVTPLRVGHRLGD
jgi:hypothetical protein